MATAKTQTGKLKQLHIAPRKARLVANSIKGMPVWRAEAILMQRPHRSAEPILKLLRSTVSNAKNNTNMDANKLVIKNIMVDGGPVMKRFMPRAFGRATPILKRMSHITLTLEESNKVVDAKFTVVDTAKEKREAKKVARKKAEKEKGKNKKDKKEEPIVKPKQEIKEDSKGLKTKDQSKSIFKKMFRRKSI